MPAKMRRAPMATFAALFIATAIACGALSAHPGEAYAKVAAKAAKPPAGHGSDFSGIWEAKPGAGNSGRATPPYNAEWAARYRTIQQRAAAGQRIHDGTSECLPPGMPRFLVFIYPIEILQTPGQVTILTEYFNQTRRIFTDGRSHPKGDDLEPTFQGHSIGHWERDTLVVDTVGMRGDTVFSNSGAPHSDQISVTERIRRDGPNEIQWDATVTDPVAFTGRFEIHARLIRSPPGTEIREYVCAESPYQETYAPG